MRILHLLWPRIRSLYLAKVWQVLLCGLGWKMRLGWLQGRVQNRYHRQKMLERLPWLSLFWRKKWAVFAPRVSSLLFPRCWRKRMPSNIVRRLFPRGRNWKNLHASRVRWSALRDRHKWEGLQQEKKEFILPKDFRVNHLLPWRIRKLSLSYDGVQKVWEYATQLRKQSLQLPKLFLDYGPYINLNRVEIRVRGRVRE